MIVLPWTLTIQRCASSPSLSDAAKRRRWRGRSGWWRCCRVRCGASACGGLPCRHRSSRRANRRYRRSCSRRVRRCAAAGAPPRSSRRRCRTPMSTSRRRSGRSTINGTARPQPERRCSSRCAAACLPQCMRRTGRASCCGGGATHHEMAQTLQWTPCACTWTPRARRWMAFWSTRTRCRGSATTLPTRTRGGSSETGDGTLTRPPPVVANMPAPMTATMASLTSRPLMPPGISSAQTTRSSTSGHRLPGL
mmetsp:Transcript_9014/g.27944  ORF Transcript_9014/g.27944 Transcript_9014/m.27944 type:complete len:251 (-) Transcript_9014:1933-2685(-)